jgi:hypothetical protein
MSDLSTPISPSFNGEKGQGTPTGESHNAVMVRDLNRSQAHESIGATSNTSRPYAPIYTLNDDVLLNVFDVYRPADLDEDQGEVGGRRVDWHRQRWWYKLVHVCRLWRNLILSSPSRLDLHLFCTYGVHIADMLSHSPPLPLIIYYHCDHVDKRMTTEDERGILLALSHPDRVRRISFKTSTSSLRKYIIAMDGQFPILDSMFIDPRGSDPSLVFPLSFQAPNLRHLEFWVTAFLQAPIGFPSLTSTAGLVTLKLVDDLPLNAHFPPSHVLTRLLIMPQLEILVIHFSQSHVESVLGHTPNITLPKLHSFVFLGSSSYLEGLVSRISAPSLRILKICVNSNYESTFTSSSLLRFMQTSEIFSFDAIKLNFNYQGTIEIVMLSSRRIPVLHLRVMTGRLGWQVRSALQILGTFSPVLSVVEQVMLRRMFPQRSEVVDRTQWRELLRFFSNAKTLYVQDWIVFEMCPDDDELPLRLLPNMRELGYSELKESDARASFTAFIDEREAADHPLNLTMVDEFVFVRPTRECGEHTGECAAQP